VNEDPNTERHLEATDHHLEAVVPPEYDDSRLDRALILCLPESSLRARRRAWENGEVLVEDRPRPMSYKVRTGQRITIRVSPIDTTALEDRFKQWPGLRVAARSETLGKVTTEATTETMTALCKPAGLPSEALAGGSGDSLEAFLPLLNLPTPAPGEAILGARLVTRLDNAASGLVLAALSQEAQERFRELEAAGKVTKRYLALVRGQVPEPCTARFRLDTADRRQVRVMENEDPDPVRWSEVTPLQYDEVKNQTLVGVVIKKGARHQIRAHLSRLGHPIVGDVLYGKGEEGPLHLHCQAVEMEGFSATCAPEWLELE
jgi:23S rRNA pseudouridine1911/1915/1917 synthase